MLFSMLQEAVRAGASRPAFVASHSRSSYRQIWKSTVGLAARLRECGVVPGSHVALLTDDAMEFATGIFAAASLGAVVVLGSVDSQSGNVGGRSITPDVDFALVPRDAAPLVVRRECGASITSVPISCDEFVPARVRQPRLHQMGPFVAECRGGSLAVVRHQANLVHEAKGVVRAVGLDAEDRIVCTLPFEQSPGLCVGLLAAVRARAALAWCPCDSPEAIEATLARVRPTVLVTDCATLSCHIAHWPSLRQHLDGVRLTLAPRSELLPHVLEVRASVPGKFMTFYHRPETGVIALNSHTGAADCAGLPLPGVKIVVERIWSSAVAGSVRSQSFGSFLQLRSDPHLSGDGWSEVTEPGVPGRIVVHSPAASPTATHNGRCYTSDRGYLDASGNLHILSEASSAAMPRARSA